MKMSSISAAVVVASLVGIPNLVQAERLDIGKREYTENCAVCHGTSGKGDGPLAGIINQHVSDLTVLSKHNNGAFPFARAYEVIDGTRETKAHGPRDMPIWGSVYNEKAPQWLGFDYTREDARGFVRGRILALIGYIQTLQEK